MSCVRRSQTARVPTRRRQDVRMTPFRKQAASAPARCSAEGTRKGYREVVALPPLVKVSSSLPVSQQDVSNSIQNSSQKLQDLFFAPHLIKPHRAFHRPPDSKAVGDRKLNSHWNVPYKKVSVEAQSQIKAHLRHHFHNRHGKRGDQRGDTFTTAADNGNETLYVLKTESFLLKDRGLKTLLDEEDQQAVVEIPCKLFQSLTMLQDHRELLESCYAGSPGTSSDWTVSSESLHPEASSHTPLPSLKGLHKATLPNADNANSSREAKGRQLSSECKTDLLLSDDDKIRDIIRGNVRLPYSAKKKRFMIYICGGYRDTVAEREALMASVYPQLYLYCKQRGYDFKMIDLRWGVEDAVSDSHNTVALHFEMLRQCQESEGPHFFLFTGQKHDAQILPTRISKTAFEAVLNVIERKRLEMSRRRLSKEDRELSSRTSVPQSSVESLSTDTDHTRQQENNSQLLDKDSLSQTSLPNQDKLIFSQMGAKSVSDFEKEISLLLHWYKLDENCKPAMYCLLPVSTHYKDFVSKDPSRRQQAKKTWLHTSQKLCKALQENSPASGGESSTSSLLRTVVDVEVAQGLQTAGPPEEHCHWYKRTITDIKYNLGSEKASDYIDILTSQPEINETLYAAHQKFMDSIHAKLRHTNIYEYSVGWGRAGISPQLNRSHLYYTQSICSHFQRTVLAHLNRLIRSKTSRESPDVRRGEMFRRQTEEEILLHIHHRHALDGRCAPGESVLVGLREVVQSASWEPVVLLGDPGSGKSTIMARVASLASSWVPGNVRVLVRFIGITGESRNVRLLLQSLCFQLCEVHNVPASFSQSLEELSNKFLSLLESVTQDSPVVIVLDGLDELSEEHNSDISWLPACLPEHVYLILSASTESSCAELLKSQATKPHFLVVTPLSQADIHRTLLRKLERDGRSVRADQWKLLTEACESCPCPLYLEIAYAESRLWTSFAAPSGTRLPGDLPGLYQAVLARLEKAHGEQLVRKSASLITLSRNGLPEEELIDLLSLDQAAMREVELSHRPSAPRLPYVLWAKLRLDFGSHLTEQNTDNTYVLNWAHSALRQACEQRYLKSKEVRLSIHAEYANYFLGKKSPHPGNSATTHVFQPLAWVLEKDSVKNYFFNLRKLHGVPYHLIKSGQVPTLLTECLFNYEFLLHKLWGLSIIDVEEDLKAAVTPEKELADVCVLSEALELSQQTLLQDPCQLASQLVGRLHEVLSTDRPVAPGDPRKFSHLHSLLSQCYSSSVPVLLPSFTCLLPPGGLGHRLLAGHAGGITAVAGAKEEPVVATASRDRTLKIWDLNSGRAVRTLRGVGSGVDSLTLCLGNTLVALTERRTLQVWHIASGQMVFSENSLDVPVATSASDGQLLVVFYDGSQSLKVFDLAASCRLLYDVTITPDDNPIHKDRSILVSRGSVKDYVLFAYRSAKGAMVLSARKAEVVTKLVAQQTAASVQGVEVTADYFLLFCRYPYLRQNEIVHIELFSTKSFAYLRSIKGCSSDPFSDLNVNRLGSHVVAFCPSAATGTSEIVTWNLETEDHKHMVKSPGLVMAGTCSDLRFCLGVCSNESYIRVWNLASRINDQSLCYNVYKVKSDGAEDVVPMKKYPRYVVWRSVTPGTVSVWKLAESGCRVKRLSLERGLYESADIALVRDRRLFILTDRGTASFTDTPRPIFQTLLIYDLLKKKYIKKQTGLYIIPCQKHEYRILDGDLLLGLSENRDHLIIWDLETGFIKSRLKPFHKEQSLVSYAANTVFGSQDRDSEELLSKVKRTKARMTPWERRNETQTAKQRRLEKELERERGELQQLSNEKHNAIDLYLLSGDEQILVCSYFAHHLNVFSLATRTHTHTLEDRASLLFLHSAALTYSGSYLAISNYSDTEKTSYVTLWDLQTGKVRKRLKNEPRVGCLAVTDDASRLVFGVMEANKVKVWDPFRKAHKTIPGYETLEMGVNSKLHVIDEGAKAILLAGDVSTWDLDAGTVLSVFTPDSNIRCLSLAQDRKTMLLGLSDSPALIAMALVSKEIAEKSSCAGAGLFAEQSSTSEEEEEEEDGKDAC
ncbi:uncharacterized protein [Lepisosteus oculatus]